MGDKLRILVVEDSAPMREVVGEYLESEGYAVDTASNGHEALAALENPAYDLILCDLRLPGPDGFSIIEQANKQQPDTPKIIMTGNSDIEDTLRAIKLGAYDFIRKPIPKLAELGVVVARGLQHRRLLSERATHLQQIETMNAELAGMNKKLEGEVSRRTEELSRANQQLRTLDEMKNNLLANVSHELRTPLVSVRGYTELFYRGHLGELPEGSESFLATSLRNIDKLLSLIESLVRYAEMARDEVALELAHTDLGGLLKRALQDAAEGAQHAGISLECNLPEEMIWILVDLKRFSAALGHVVENAIKFNESGTTVTLQAEKITKSLIKVSVIDDGVGIPHEEQGRIFERFYQLDSSPTRKHGGTGMGLAIARDNLRLMGCELRVNSEPGKGSTFYWTLPMANAPKTE